MTKRGKTPHWIKTPIHRHAIPHQTLLAAQGQKRAEDAAGIVREVSAYGKTGELNITLSPNERELCMRIAIRGAEFMRAYGVEEDVMTSCMDIAVCHLNCQPLRLLDFATTADVTDFAHDYARIRRFINRTTGKLGPEAGDPKDLKFAEKSGLFL